MTPEDYLIKVGRAIENRPRTGMPSFCIVIVGDAVYCRPSRGGWPLEYNLGRFTERNLERGLTKKQWNIIKARVTSYLAGERKDSDNERVPKMSQKEIEGQRGPKLFEQT